MQLESYSGQSDFGPLPNLAFALNKADAAPPTRLLNGLPFTPKPTTTTASFLKVYLTAVDARHIWQGTTSSSLRPSTCPDLRARFGSIQHTAIDSLIGRTADRPAFELVSR